MTTRLVPSATHDRSLRLAAVLDRCAMSWERTGVRHFAELARRLVRHAEPRPGDHVLDVACAAGEALVLAAGAVGPSGTVIGMDVSAHMTRRAARAVVDHGLANCWVATGDVAAGPPHPIPLADGAFDVAMAGIATCLSPWPERVAARCAELLRAGGRFALPWWGLPDPRWIAALDASVRHHQAESAHWLAMDSPFWTVESVHEMLRAAGFASVRTSEEPLLTRFTGPEQWWAWVWSTPAREFFESLPHHLVPVIHREVCAALAALREPDGSLLCRSVARFTVATTPR
ncbi:class I SAM-dependent methyltransferase [Streptoalloteichus hindustanus]|uniref:Ubiquinone/menaquinone biosynthesis C-methylase UbiE n=1 Tax=Streptoalloteichus hindustanus TaxID=2017 RepID=A0A1M5ABG8_STRHI|nr:methyltransferase domain-containing protein [Streptoalloteichus hindustanus]SHF27589.1 Ubiquinone/menaquinone biosynthesis C-methylase UbiE [Streptoalloteichus hindustanus]